ncbi:hypothetical protein ABMA70_07130 [Halobacteriovorax sp. XZX-3]|uniref:hypothetical protein n=1 Tax=unclassified Halobacteriovorax TaxID=2639665 RepID=UPI003715FC52
MKKILSSVAVIMLSSSTYANIIVPEISRDGKSRNSSVIATSQEKRKFVSVEYNSSTFEKDNVDSELDRNSIDIYGEWSNSMFTFAADLRDGKGDYHQVADYDYDYYNIAIGYRLNERLSLGLAHTVDKEAIDSAVVHTDSQLPETEFGLSYKLNNLVIGASIAHHSSDRKTTIKSISLVRETEGDWYGYRLGVGSNANNMSWEAGIEYNAEGDSSSDTTKRDSKFGVFAGITKVINDIEFDADIFYITGDNLVETNLSSNDYKKLNVNLDAEILIGKMFYVTPGLYYNDRVVGPVEEDSLGLSADFGYRANSFDATLGVDYQLSGEYIDGTGAYDTDQMAWKVNVAYNF